MKPKYKIVKGRLKVEKHSFYFCIVKNERKKGLCIPFPDWLTEGANDLCNQLNESKNDFSNWGHWLPSEYVIVK